MKVLMACLTEEEEKRINPRVWVKKGNRGSLQVSLIKVTLKQPGENTCRGQYPVPLKEKRSPAVTEGFVKDGLLEPCTSPYHTPIFLVRKPDGSYQLVQDLWAINQIVQTRHPVVPNPYTILSKIPYKHKWFSAVDLEDAFWACPLSWIAKTFLPLNGKIPLMETKQQCHWTMLPQGD